MHSEESHKFLAEDEDGECERLMGSEAALTVLVGSSASKGVRVRNWLLAAQSLLLLVVLVAWGCSLRSTSGRPNSQLLYSPAQDAIVYEVKRWVEDIWTDNPYKGEPSEEVDKAWTDLYNDFGVSQIPKWQADLLPNRTLPIPADPGKYVIQLSVFHQMHCLNTIRKALRPHHYVDPVTGDLGNIPKENLHNHLSHCIDSIRQGLMCAVDISPIIWEWSEHSNRAIINMDVVHSCRNYDMVVDWAKTHRIQHHFDWSVHPHV